MNSRQLRAQTISLFAAINFLAMTLTAISVEAQTNTLPTTGNVGIGTTTPEMPLEVNGFYKLQDVRHYRIVRTYGPNVGDWAQVGSFANTGVSQYAEFQVQGHWCGSIVSARFRFDSTAYNTGAEGSTNWIELPVLDGGKSWNGTFQPVAIDVKRDNLSSTSDPIQVRIRNLTQSCPSYSSQQFINIESNAALTASDASYPNGTVDTGYMGSNIGFKFPVVQSGWSATTRGLFVVNSGNVGIGTTAPYSQLSLTSSDSTTGISLFTSPYESPRYWGTRIYKQDSFGGHANGIPLVIDTQYGSTWYTSATFGAGVDPYHPSFRSYGQTYLASDGGNVGVGTTAPGRAFDVKATDGSGVLRIGSTNIGIGSIIDMDANIYGAGGRDYRLISSGSGNGAIGGSKFAIEDAGNYRFVLDSSGNVGIGQPAPGYRLDVNGTAHVSGNLTVDGNLAAKYQDVAEWVPSSEQLAAGTVVVLDSTKSNQVTSSSVSYDTRVAGVISEQPGIALGEKSEGKVLVATTGRVRVKVDATKRPIHIGDLLVTSDVPGVAMKSEAVNLGGVQIHRPGTLIGKALEPLENGKGEILVLLSLQ